MNKRHMIILLLLCVLALTSLWINKQHFKKVASSASQAPTFMATNAKQFYTQTNRDTIITLHANDMQTYSNQHKTIYHQIHIEVLKNNQLTWTMDANQGFVDSKHDKKITLSGQVLLQRRATSDLPASTLKTSELIINPTTRQATSDHLVHLAQANTQMSGLGLHADLKTGTIKLLSNIETHYAPTDSQ